MKIRKSDSYLILSSAHLGISKDILAVFKQASLHYKPKVIHLGPVSSAQNVQLYQKLNERLDALSKKEPKTEASEEKLYDTIHQIEIQARKLEQAELDTKDLLVSTFGHVEFIMEPGQSIGLLKGKNVTLTMGGRQLSKYLYLSPILPSGEKSTNDPFSQRAMEYLRQFGQSCIVAHPIPSAKSMPRPGLNEAYNYWSVGSLRHQEEPTSTSSQYLVAHLPSAILVLVDKENGEFHPKALHIDYLERGHKSKKTPMILDDGLVFFEKKTTEAPSADKANYVTDQHAKYWQRGVVASFRAVNVLHQPETIIDGGDTSDFAAANRHGIDLPGEMEGLRLRHDLLQLRALLSAMVNVPSIKRKVMIDSNHHEWLTLKVLKDPALIGMLDWPTLAKEFFGGWEIMIRKAGNNEIFHFGDLMIRHGDKEAGGVVGGSKLSALGKYLCGHFHSFRAFRRAIQLGCGCMLGPKYVGGRVTSWQNMLATLTKFKEITAVNPKTILHDSKKDTSRFAYSNKIYEVPSFDIEVDLNQRIYK